MGSLEKAESARLKYRTSSSAYGVVALGSISTRTWFGDREEYALGIQTMPVTAWTGAYTEASWVDAVDFTFLEEAEEEWRSVILPIISLARPKDAAEEAQKLRRWDHGTSEGIVRWFVEANGGDFYEEGEGDDDADKGEGGAGAECDTNEGCVGLIGLCCPTNAGIMLECC